MNKSSRNVTSRGQSRGGKRDVVKERELWDKRIERMETDLKRIELRIKHKAEGMYNGNQDMPFVLHDDCLVKSINTKLNLMDGYI